MPCYTVHITQSSFQNFGYEYWDVLITLFYFHNFYIPLPGSLIILSGDSLFTGFGFGLGNINMIIPVNCSKLFSGFISIVSKIHSYILGLDISIIQYVKTSCYMFTQLKFSYCTATYTQSCTTNLKGIRFGVYTKLRLLAHSMLPVCLKKMEYNCSFS